MRRDTINMLSARSHNFLLVGAHSSPASCTAPSTLAVFLSAGGVGRAETLRDIHITGWCVEPRKTHASLSDAETIKQ